MDKAPRLGSDPLAWMRDTTKETPEEITARDIERDLAGTGFAAKSVSDVLIKKPIPVHDSIQSIPDVPGGPGKHGTPGVPSAEAGMLDGWTRWSLIAKKDRVERLKRLAYWRRKHIKEIVDEAFEQYLVASVQKEELTREPNAGKNV